MSDVKLMMHVDMLHACDNVNAFCVLISHATIKR